MGTVRLITSWIPMCGHAGGQGTVGMREVKTKKFQFLNKISNLSAKIKYFSTFSFISFTFFHFYSYFRRKSYNFVREYL